MKPVTSRQLATKLSRKLEQTGSALDDALSWVNNQRAQVPRLELEADRLTRKLYRLSNQTRNLASACQQECAIGFFGLAQSGKEYLIKSLLHDGNDRMVLDFAGHPLDYAQRLNPWQQSAIIVQRFTCQSARGDSRWPVHLTLLSETGIVWMLALCWHQRETPAPALDEQQIIAQLENLLRYRQNETVAGISAADMVALQDRYQRSACSGRKALDNHFWPLAMDLAPRLSVDDRASLFSLLWQDDAELTALYRLLAHTLHHLGNARQLAAPLESIDNAACSILNSSALHEFNTSADITLSVAPRHQGRLLKPVTLSLSQLALISREVTLPLHTAPREALFEQVDVLDFPGVGACDKSDSRLSPLMLAIIQAKRSLLLSLASEEQQMHWLLICTACAERGKTRLIAELLDFWVRQTGGEESELRKQARPGLIWALTPYDYRITTGQNYDAAIQRFAGNPGSDWGSMLLMDDKGVLRMANWLTSEVKRETRLARLSERYQELCRELHDNLLAPWLQQESAADPAARQRIAETLLGALQVKTGVHGELLEWLLPDRDTLRYLFRQPYRQSKKSAHHHYALPDNDPFSSSITIDLLSDVPELPGGSTEAAPLSESVAFARQVYHYWINLLRLLPDNRTLQALPGITKPMLAMLTEELITGSIRLNIAATLEKTLADPLLACQQPDQIAERQVSRALSVLGDYIAWLGFQSVAENDRPDSRIHSGQKIFARPAAQSFSPGQRLTKLSVKPLNPAACYVGDWLVALNTLIVQNAGWSASRDLSNAARQALALIAARVVP